jgi:hypothetical protein
LHIIDAVFGLALVAYSEEIVFRRCAVKTRAWLKTKNPEFQR